MLTDKVLTLVFGLLFLMMIACSDNAETDTAQQDGKPPVVREMSRSAAFVDYAASTNMLQTEIAKVAVARAQHEDVKVLANQMLAFYEEAQQSLRQVARSEGLQNSLPDSLGSADRATIEEFRKLPSGEVDERYRQYISSAHKSQLDHYQEMLARAEEAEIRNWVNEMHLQLRARLQLAGQYHSVKGRK
jgi:putative membrane protein